MAGALVVSTSQDINGSGSGGTTTGINTTGADLLVAMIASYAPGGSGTLSDLVGGNSNTWVPLTAQTGAIVKGQFFYAKNATVGSGHTFTFTGSGVYPSISVMAFSGSDLTAPFDQENGANTAGSSIATGNVTPSTNNQIIVAASGFNQPGVTMSIDSGFTGLVQTTASGSVEGNAMAYLIQTTAGSVNPTLTPSSVSSLSAVIATFKTATSPPPPSFNPGWANRATSGVAGSGVQ